MEILPFRWRNQRNGRISRCVHDEVGASVGKRRTDGGPIHHTTERVRTSSQRESNQARKLRIEATSALSSSVLCSSASNWMARDAIFSSRWATERVPGIKTIWGERARNQARATWAGVAWCLCAMVVSGPTSRPKLPMARGKKA